jgi:hypothetical protein
MIDVYVVLEGEEFSVEKLRRGSVINHRTCFTEEKSMLYYKFL